MFITVRSIFSLYWLFFLHFPKMINLAATTLFFNSFTISGHLLSQWLFSPCYHKKKPLYLLLEKIKVWGHSLFTGYILFQSLLFHSGLNFFFYSYCDPDLLYLLGWHVFHKRSLPRGALKGRCDKQIHLLRIHLFSNIHMALCSHSKIETHQTSAHV